MYSSKRKKQHLFATVLDVNDARLLYGVIQFSTCLVDGGRIKN